MMMLRKGAAAGAWGSQPVAPVPFVSGKLAALRRSTSSGDRRREARYPCADRCDIRIRDGRGERLPATLRDVSRSGLRVEFTMPISKGIVVEVILPKEVVIFGEVRHCRRFGEIYQVGVQIQEIFFRRPGQGHHLHDDELSLYLVGKGLTAAEVMRLREHLPQCRFCQGRLAEADATLNPRKRQLPF